MKQKLCGFLNPLLKRFNLTLSQQTPTTLWDDDLIAYYRYQQSLQTDNPLSFPKIDYPPKDFFPTMTEWEEVSHLLKPNMTICELGVGTGRFTDLYFSSCDKVYLVDLSKNICEIILENKYSSYSQVEILQCSNCRMPAIPDASVDLFFGFGVFSHCNSEQLLGYLDEGMRILKPTGKLIIEYQSLSNEIGWKRFLSRVPEDFSESIFRYHSTESLERLAKRMGYKINRSIIDKNDLNGSYLALEKPKSKIFYEPILKSATKKRTSTEVQQFYSATGIATPMFEKEITEETQNIRL